MIKLAKLIKENEGSSLYNVISEEEALKLLKSQYSGAYQLYSERYPHFVLYRAHDKYDRSGKEREHGYIYTDPRSQKRVSRGTNNFYTEFISISPNWKNYPPRNQALIGGTSRNVAAEYGSLMYCVFPKNGARFALCSQADMWSSMDYAEEYFTGKGMWGLNTLMNDLIIFFSHVAAILGIEGLPMDETSLADLMGNNTRKFLSILDNNIDKITDNWRSIEDYVDQMEYLGDRRRRLQTFSENLKKVKEAGSFTAAFNEAFDPLNNKIELIDSISGMTHVIGGKEFWTDSECILVPEDFVKGIIGK